MNCGSELIPGASSCMSSIIKKTYFKHLILGFRTAIMGYSVLNHYSGKMDFNSIYT